MLSKNEKKLLFLLRYTPILIVTIISIIITLLLFLEKEKNYNNEIESLKVKFHLENQNRIKNEVYRVYEYIKYEKQKDDLFLKNEIKLHLEQAYKTITYIYEKYKDTQSKEQIINRIFDSLKEHKFYNNKLYISIYDRTEHNSLLTSDNISTSLIFEPYNWIITTNIYDKDYEDKIKNRILEYINTIKYSTNGYVFIVDYDGVYLSHVKKSYIGKNRINLKDKNGFMITQEIIKTAKNNEGFIRYVGTIKPDTNLPAPKITFIKGFNDWNWAIATGFYDDELDKQIKEKADYLKKEKKRDIFNLFIISIVITMMFLIISIYLAKILEKYLIRYRREVLIHINKNREKDSMLAQQSKMAAMGEMIENIAHQWRQPLNLISISSTGMKLKKEHDILSNEEFNQGMDQITKSSNYLSQTIDDFREFFSPNKKKVLFNIKDTFEKTFELLNAQLLAKDIVLIKDIDEVEIYSYENELIQVIINLINNAKDELVKCKNMKRMIFISAKANLKTLTIIIKDNAGGINEDIINRIFEPYFTTKHKRQGTGIGLYMSREIIVKHMKGSLEVFNKEYTYKEVFYTGASFHIKLSLKKDV